MPIDTFTDLRHAMTCLLAQAIGEDGATKGNVQLVDRKAQRLMLFVQQGFDDKFIRAFATVGWDDNTACGRAFRNGARVVIPDILLDATYKPYVKLARAAGYRAVQSTPMFDENGQVVGVLSTHFPRPQSLSGKAACALDALAGQAAHYILELG